MTSAKQHQFPILDGMRGVAAIAVMFFHFRQMLIPGHNRLINTASGYLAVDLFFLLSGFVIAHAYERRLAGGMGLVTFTTTRLIRLLPMLWIGAAVGMVAAVVEHRLSWPGVAGVGLLNAFLIPTPFGIENGFYPVNGAQWSLFYEMLINIAYAAVLFRLPNKALATIIAAAAIGLIACAFHYGRLQSGWNIDRLPVGLSRVTFSFLVGALLWRLRDRWLSRIPAVPSWMLYAATLAPLCVPAPEAMRPIYDLLFIMIAAPILVMFGAASQASARGLGVAVAGGELSYPLYAYHQPVRDLVRDWAASSSLHTPYVAIGTIAVIVPLSFFLARHYDKPFRDKLTAWAKQLRLITPIAPPPSSGAMGKGQAVGAATL